MPRRRTVVLPALAGLLLFAILLLAIAMPVPSAAHAQETRSAAARTAERHRKRAVSSWRRYVWTLDRVFLEQVAQDLAEATRVDKSKPDFSHQFLLAYAHLALGNRKDGVAALERAVEQNPKFPGLLLLDAFVAILDGERSVGVEQLTAYIDALATAPRDPNFGAELEFLGYVHRGTQLHGEGQHDRVIADLQRAKELSLRAKRRPATELSQRLALAHQMVRQFPEAEAILKEALADDPGNAVHYYNIGLLKGMQQDWDGARRWHRAALARQSDYAAPHAKLAYLDWREGQLTGMRAHLDAYTGRLGATLDEATKRAEALTGYGLYWRALGNRLWEDGRKAEAETAYAEAVVHLREALVADAGCIRALNELVQLGYQGYLPEDEFNALEERYKAIRRETEGAPRVVRTTFC